MAIVNSRRDKYMASKNELSWEGATKISLHIVDKVVTCRGVTGN